MDTKKIFASTRHLYFNKASKTGSALSVGTIQEIEYGFALVLIPGCIQPCSSYIYLLSSKAFGALHFRGSLIRSQCIPKSG
jgi:hypothetical protein